MAAYEAEDWLAVGMYNNLVAQLVRALDKVERGLGVDLVACKGVGRAVSRRYKRFHCTATSRVIEIPTVASIERVNQRELVTQGPPRLVGPLTATLEVHARGRSKLAYRTMSQ